MVDSTQNDDPTGSHSDTIEIDIKDPSNNRSTDPLYRERPNKTTDDSFKDRQTSDRIKSTEPDFSKGGHYTLGGKLLEDRVSSVGDLIQKSKYGRELELLDSIEDSIRCLDEVNQNSQSTIDLALKNYFVGDKTWRDIVIESAETILSVTSMAYEFVLTKNISDLSKMGVSLNIVKKFNEAFKSYDKAEITIKNENNARYERCMAPLEAERKRKGIRIRSNNNIP